MFFCFISQFGSIIYTETPSTFELSVTFYVGSRCQTKLFPISYYQPNQLQGGLWSEFTVLFFLLLFFYFLRCYLLIKMFEIMIMLGKVILVFGGTNLYSFLVRLTFFVEGFCSFYQFVVSMLCLVDNVSFRYLLSPTQDPQML